MKKGKAFIILCLLSLMLMGCNQKESKQKDNGAANIYDKVSAEKMSEPNYQPDSSAANHAFYYDDVIVYLGIDENDNYESVINKLGTPYYDNKEPAPSSVVYLKGYKTYVEVFFNEKTGKVSYISCIQE